jgi:PIN domain nuclease of toxin-antitoxin system
MKRPAPERLRPFRLNEIPLDVRLAAARHARVFARPDDEKDPRDRLFAALAELAPSVESEEAVHEREALTRVARSPSDRVYWIRESAWKKVMGDSAWAKVMG